MSSASEPRVFAVIGSPIAHSRSPVMHTAGFAAAGLPHVYVALQVEPEALADAVRGVVALGLAGINVTVPHKERIVTYLDALDPAAERIGAVNTVVIAGGRSIGHNTDRDGMLDALKELGVMQVEHAMVLGGGGAARAVCDAVLHGLGAGRLTWVTRTPERLATPLLDPRVHVVGWEGLADALEGCDLLVNATPVGMHGGPSSFPVPLPFDRLANAAVVDLVYPRREGSWLDEAQRAGARVQDGLPLLLWQGVRAQALWLQEPRPTAVVEAMRRALLPPLG